MTPRRIGEWCSGLLLLLGLSACGDPCGVSSVLASRCDRLCCDVAEAIEPCVGTGLTWSDLGAADRADYAARCVEDWDRTTDDLTAYELQEATEVCDTTRDDLAALVAETSVEARCERLRATYGP